MAPTSSAATFSSAASTSSYVVQQQEERRSTTIVTTNAASEHSQGTGAQPLSAEGQPSKEASKSDSGTTTTLSTIAIERGQTRLVIALLKSGRRLDLKVLELKPGLACLGKNFAEASSLQSDHSYLLEGVQSKQSPVEDLLRQADELIAGKKQEVYADMAESLGRAWKLLNQYLERRRELLQQNFLFHGHFQDFKEKADELTLLCRANVDLTSQTSISETVRALLKAKRAMLETSVYTLQEGDSLLEKFKALQTEATSWEMRPGLVRQSVALAVGQVELWLEELHERRVSATSLLEQRLASLRQRMISLGSFSELASLQSLIKTRRQALSKLVDLGSSVSNCDALIRETVALQSEAHDISERCSRAVGGLQGAATEDSIKAYDLVSQNAEYQQELEKRTGRLAQAMSFFECAQAANYRMDQIEMQVRNIDIGQNGPETRSLLQSLTNSLRQTAQEAVSKGDTIVANTGNKAATRGISQAMEQMKTRASAIRSMSDLKVSQVSRSHEALKGFVKKLDELKVWASNIVEHFLDYTITLGTTPEASTAFLESHNDMLNKIHMKTFELEGLRGALKAVSEQCSNEETKKIEARMDETARELKELTGRISSRIALVEKLLKLERLIAQIDKEMDSVERQLHNSERIAAEETRVLIQQLYLQACNLGKNLTEDGKKLRDRSIDETVTLNFIQNEMSRLDRRQTALIEIWKNVDIKAREGRRQEEEWGRLHKEKRESMEFSLSIDQELFPIVANCQLDRPSLVTRHLEERLMKLPKQKMITERFVQLISRVEELLDGRKLPEERKEEAKTMVGELRQKLKALQVLFQEYELILQMLIPFFKNYVELDEMRKNLVDQYRNGNSPVDVTEAELMAREHEAGRGSLLEIVRFAKRERDVLVHKMDELKSRSLMAKDRAAVASLLETVEADFQGEWNRRKNALTKSARFCLLANAIKSLSQDIQELHQTAKMKMAVGETVASLQGAFKFLDVISLGEIERRIVACRDDAASLERDVPMHAASVKMSLAQVEDSWKKLNDFLSEQQSKLASAEDYFRLLDESERFLRDANKRLLIWSRQISSVNNESDAKRIRGEIEQFIRLNKEKQSNSFYKMSSTAGVVFGHSVFEKIQVIQREQNDTFEALSGLVAQIDTFLSHQKTLGEENKRKNEAEVTKAEIAKKAAAKQAEMEASIRAAKAEAESAKRAARQAEEARRAAEEASVKAIREAKTIKTQTELEVCGEATSAAVRHVAPLFTEYLQDMVLREGEKCRLRARVSGTPAPHITWFKDGVPVQDNGDYQSKFDHGSGLCTLTIDETFVEDSANWSVRASNQAGYAESHAKLTVKEIKEEGTAPVIVRGLKDVAVHEEERIEFKCEVTGNPPAEVSWFKNGRPVDKTFCFIGEDGKGGHIFRMERAALADQGDVTIRATNKSGTATSSARLEVRPFMKKVMPEFVQPLCNVEATTKQPVILECRVQGTPTPQLQWYHNGRALKKGCDHDMFYDGTTAMLKIRNALSTTLQTTVGQYLCRAKNFAGEASSTCTVTASFADQVAEAKPAFYVPLRNLSVDEDEDVIMECVVVAHPAAIVTWYRNNVPIKESQGIGMEREKDCQRLFLTSIKEAQRGEYKVKASNKLGDCYSTCSLRVHPKKSLSAIGTQTSIVERDKTEYVAHASVKSRSTMVTPKFIKRLQPKLVNEGEKVELEGIIKAVPNAKVSWTFNGKLLRPSRDVSMHDDNNKVSLTIDRVRHQHSGEYSCMAVNMAGSAESSARLSVQKKKQAPTFIQSLRDGIVQANQRFEAEVEVQGTPIPEVHWFKNNNMIENSPRVFVRRDGRKCSLVIPKAQESDSGTYRVVASNMAGKRVSSARLVVPAKATSAPSLPSSAPSLGSETRSSSFLQFREPRPLPQLYPFPFKPDPETPKRKRNLGKVPKPSKFIKGEMYHSDYESDLEGPIPSRWRAYASDSEDTKLLVYRRVQPVLDRRGPKKERKQSPPCPHVWESHEDIARLERDLKKTSDLYKAELVKTSSSYEKVEITEELTTKVSFSGTHGRNLFQPLPKTGTEPSIEDVPPEIITVDCKVDKAEESPAHIPLTVEEINNEEAIADRRVRTKELRRMWEEKLQHPRSSSLRDLNRSSSHSRQDSRTTKVTSSFRNKQSLMTRSLDQSMFRDSQVLQAPKYQPPLPCEVWTLALSPPPSQIGSSVSPTDVSISSQSTVRQVGSAHITEESKETATTASHPSPVVKRPKFVSVREKVKILEQKVEEQDAAEDAAAAAIATNSESDSSFIRPEEIPGAVRVLPNSRRRSTSVESAASLTNMGPHFRPPSPKLLPFPFRPDSVEPSRTAPSPLPPPATPSKFIPREVQSDTECASGGRASKRWIRPSAFAKQPHPISFPSSSSSSLVLHNARRDVEITNDNINSASKLPDATTSLPTAAVNVHSMGDVDPAVNTLTSHHTSVYRYDLQQMESSSSSLISASQFEQMSSSCQRIELDSTAAVSSTSSTLERRQVSVRSSGGGGDLEGGYEADTDDTLKRRGAVAIHGPDFVTSGAYIAPSWAGDLKTISCAEKQQELQTSVLRFDQKLVSVQETKRSNGQSTAKSIPVFKPMKFVPGSAHGASNPAKWTPPQTGNDGGDDKKLIKTITGDLAPAVGTSVVLEVVLSPKCLAKDSVRAEWRLNGQPLVQDGDRHHVSKTPDGFSLRLTNVATESNGTYSCTVVTDEITETRECQVTVIGESLL